MSQMQTGQVGWADSSVRAAGRRNRFFRHASPYFLIFPSIALMAAIILVPLVRGIIMSFNSVNIIKQGEMHFVGLQNYAQMISDPVFHIALRNTAIWTLGVVSLQYLLGLVVALLLNEPIPLRGLFRGLVLVPWVVPSVVAALDWRWIYAPDYGILNYVLSSIGVISDPLQWLSDRHLAMLAVIIVGVWKSTPFMAVVLLAGLQSIPKELYDAAEVDGASMLQRFWYITFPNLRYLSMIVTMLAIIWTFNDFDIAYVMTKGGPSNATHLLSTYAYLSAFTYSDLGYAAAISVVMLVILLVFAIFYSRMLTKGNELA
ncbi:MAG: sugar ABC transporter permease [Chloroflexi bacterium]|nr:sugar ABC transporter permease [Chloroflexota bacterium]